MRSVIHMWNASSGIKTEEEELGDGIDRLTPGLKRA